MRCGFDADWALDLDILSFNALVQAVDLDELENRHSRFVDLRMAQSWDGKAAEDHSKTMRKAIKQSRGAPDQIDDLTKAFGGG